VRTLSSKEGKMQEESTLRVGIAGCGYQGRVIAQAIASLDSLQVVAGADPDEAALEELMEHAPQAAHYAAVDDLLAQENVDVVVVATPHHLLYETALAAIHAGKHVLVEKPIGMDEKEAAQLEAAAGQAGICFLSGYSFRYLPAWQHVRVLLQAGAVGEIQAITGSIGTRPMDSGWRATPETGGGPLLYVGCHLVDQILWYLNDAPVEVLANVRYRTDTKAEEIAAFQMRFARGATAQCVVSQNAKGMFNPLTIYGTQGQISLRTTGFFEYAVEVASVAPAADALPAFVPPPPDDPRMIKHRAQLAEFVQVIRGGGQPAVTVSDGRRVLKVLDAVIKSSRTGGVVCIG
jgi:predicted dehydrogenase